VIPAPLGTATGRAAWRVAAALVAIVVALAGCAAPAQRNVTALPALGHPPRVVLMPLDVELRQLTAGGTEQPQAEWTDVAQRYIVAAFAAEAADRGLALVSYAPERGSEVDRERGRELIRLHRVVSESVLVHHYTRGMALPAKQGRFDWSLGPGAAAIARSQDADYALFLVLRDSYATSGRYAVIAARMLLLARLPLGVPAGAQVGYASLVDLSTGNIVWFNLLSRGSGNLRTAEAARETVRALLADLPR